MPKIRAEYIDARGEKQVIIEQQGFFKPGVHRITDSMVEELDHQLPPTKGSKITIIVEWE
jgi:hypothetical protein